MINDGNSLRELQERVLLASPHVTKSESSSMERLPSWHHDILMKVLDANLRLMVYHPPRGKLFLAQLLQKPSKPSLSVYATKGNAKATSGVTSLRGARADYVIVDDLVDVPMDDYYDAIKYIRTVSSTG